MRRARDETRRRIALEVVARETRTSRNHQASPGARLRTLRTLDRSRRSLAAPRVQTQSQKHGRGDVRRLSRLFRVAFQTPRMGQRIMTREDAIKMAQEIIDVSAHYNLTKQNSFVDKLTVAQWVEILQLLHAVDAKITSEKSEAASDGN
jgi:hypothetical protein